LILYGFRLIFHALSVVLFNRVTGFRNLFVHVYSLQWSFNGAWLILVRLWLICFCFFQLCFMDFDGSRLDLAWCCLFFNCVLLLLIEVGWFVLILIAVQSCCVDCDWCWLYSGWFCWFVQLCFSDSDWFCLDCCLCCFSMVFYWFWLILVGCTGFNLFFTCVVLMLIEFGWILVGLVCCSMVFGWFWLILDGRLLILFVFQLCFIDSDWVCLDFDWCCLLFNAVLSIFIDFGLIWTVVVYLSIGFYWFGLVLIWFWLISFVFGLRFMDFGRCWLECGW